MTLGPAFPPLAFPPAALRLRGAPARPEVYDGLRGKWVRLTPEEWVRQHLAAFLVGHRRAAPGRVRLEIAYPYNELIRRADLVVFGGDGRPVLLAECKAPSVALTQATFEQVGRYNTAVGAALVVVTNGRRHYVYAAGPGGALAFRDDVPDLGVGT